jgi:hypothetical protein
MSIFKTGLTLDPNSYITAAKGYNELAQIQRQNQARIDAEEIRDRVRKAQEQQQTSFVPDAPDLSAPQSAGLRQMPVEGATGPYKTVPGSEQDRMLREQDIDYIPDSPLLPRDIVIQQAARQKQNEGLGLPRFGSGTRGMFFGVGPKFTDVKMTDEAVLSRDIAGQADYQTFERGDKLPGLFTGELSADTPPSIEEFQKQKEVKVDNTGRVVRVSDSKQLGLQKNGDVSERIQTADERVREDYTKRSKKYIKNPSGIGIDIKKELDSRKSNAEEANRYYRLAQQYYAVYQNSGSMADLNSYQAVKNIADKYKGIVGNHDKQILYLEGMQGINDLAQGSTGRASKVLSAYSGKQTEIVKRDDDKFDVYVNGQLSSEEVTFDKLSAELRLQFDSTYKQQVAKSNAEMAMEKFKSDLDTAKELQVALANAKTERMKIMLQKEADQGAKVVNVGGEPYVEKGGKVFAVEEFETKIGDVEQTNYRLKPIDYREGNFIKSNPYEMAYGDKPQ